MVTSVVASGDKLYTGDSDGKICMWDANTGTATDISGTGRYLFLYFTFMQNCQRYSTKFTAVVCLIFLLLTKYWWISLNVARPSSMKVNSSFTKVFNIYSLFQFTHLSQVIKLRYRACHWMEELSTHAASMIQQKQSIPHLNPISKSIIIFMGTFISVKFRICLVVPKEKTNPSVIPLLK